MKSILKILISYHKPSNLLKGSIYLPIHVGRDIAEKRSKDGQISEKDYKWLIENLIGDNTGDNISAKNREWCELTAIYWAWKNYDKIGNPDYIGFMHYRRFFDFGKYKYKNDIQNFVQNYDFIILERAILSGYDKNNYDQYKNFEHHYIEDLEKAINIVKRLSPEYSDYADKYLKLDYSYFCNMFIMKKELFFKYCKWIFSILNELEKELDLTNYNMEERRCIACIAERLTGIFYIKSKIEGLRCKELPMTTPDKTILSAAIVRFWKRLKLFIVLLSF